MTNDKKQNDCCLPFILKTQVVCVEFDCSYFRDGDSVLDINDNCIEVSNGDQADNDEDGLGILFSNYYYIHIFITLLQLKIEF